MKMAETWYEAQIWNPTIFIPVGVISVSNNTITLEDGTRRPKATKSRIIAPSRRGLKLLLIAHYEREALQYERWAQAKRQAIAAINEVSETDTEHEGAAPER